MAKELNLDESPHPGTLPELGLGDLLIWAPVIEELIVDVRRAIQTGGTVSGGPLRLKIHGRHVTLNLQVTVSP